MPLTNPIFLEVADLIERIQTRAFEIGFRIRSLEYLDDNRKVFTTEEIKNLLNDAIKGRDTSAASH